MAVYTVLAFLDAPSGGVFDFPSLSLGSYRVLHAVMAGIRVTTDGTRIKATWYVSASEVTTGYRHNSQSAGAGGGVEDDGSTSSAGHFFQDANLSWHVANGAEQSFGGVLRIDAPLSTAHYKKSLQHSAYSAEGGGATAVGVFGGAIMENAGAIDGLKISGDSAFTAGRVRILAVA